MKAPDKIYIHEVSATELALPVKEYHIEYIRKDLLLEWAKEQSVSCDGSVAMKRAYDKLIEKLNTL